ncbi:MAG: hypothetical protein Q9222_005292 [Ikaeria aurantiellina]
MAMTQPLAKQIAEHGTQIYFYNNIRTNQVIYSLTRTLDNHHSLKQLPFLGKKTVPARLRKDLWHPLCLVEFPRPSQGLLAYRRLREFRRLHETSYPLSLITQTEGPHKGQLHSTKKRGKILMDQKANSIADLAEVLRLQQEGPSEKTIEAAEKRLKRVTMLKDRGKKSMSRRDPQEPEKAGVEGVTIRWANLLDADFARQWPEPVIHDGLTRHRYTAVLPQVEGGTETTGGAQAMSDIPIPLPSGGSKAVNELRA